ncbi:single myb histone 1 [Selaginella moellendorffii]|uniref:single myb histone 1 n=1 Tax=Selaginella moellendorffii TaxID=88036 RepID=UPI000D1C6CB0|nr:single myb histone 1 [Selaginella moellendorffii]|eukprot:XP_002984724.2 single myb histone 1 [Selaginella moellendorffii]
MTVGQQKQKWTAEEEAALRAGVEKYGAGKWRAIQKDEEFGPVLVSRSNVDLKDKWRNISATNNGNRNRGKGAGQKAGGRRAKSQDGSDKEELSPVPDSEKKMLGTKYDNLILGALSALKEPNGSSITDIAEYIEERQSVPPSFKKLVVSKLKSMVLEGKLIKVHQNYKINDEFPSDGRAKFQRLRNNQDDKQPTFSRDITRKLRTDSIAKRTKLDPDALERRKTAEEAARVAALAVAAAEQAALAAEQAARESELADQDLEMKQAAADVALAATRTKKPMKAVAAMGREVVAVTV